MSEIKQLPRCHWNKQHGKKRRAKRAFETEQEAIEYMEYRHLENRYTAYQCPICNKWHIGHNIIHHEIQTE